MVLLHMDHLQACTLDIQDILDTPALDFHQCTTPWVHITPLRQDQWLDQVSLCQAE